ncbi:921_t:CDS:2 [Funneliformis caledonium]|uniref:921_t:CDS:1 n=1 Tax=Funneliformis caledonium TaxID=1117310 RepID=A0A9N9EP74_9GLOM|nr:921_t:CDS:2 [Funneliformis caledonium]
MAETNLKVENNEERNSAKTKCRNRVQAKRNAKKNGQTIDHFFSIAKSNESDEISEESENELNNDDDYFQQVINSLETQLKEKNLDEGHKLRLIAIL